MREEEAKKQEDSEKEGANTTKLVTSEGGYLHGSVGSNLLSTPLTPHGGKVGEAMENAGKRWYLQGAARSTTVLAPYPLPREISRYSRSNQRTWGVTSFAYTTSTTTLFIQTFCVRNKKGGWVESWVGLCMQLHSVWILDWWGLSNQIYHMLLKEGASPREDSREFTLERNGAEGKLT